LLPQPPDSPGTGKCLHTFEGHKDKIAQLSIAPDGEYGFSGSYDGSIKVWCLARREWVRDLEGHVDKVMSVDVSADGRILLLGSCDRTIKVWSVETGECLYNLRGHEGEVYAVSLSYDGPHGLSGSRDDDGQIKIWRRCTFLR